MKDGNDVRARKRERERCKTRREGREKKIQVNVSRKVMSRGVSDKGVGASKSQKRELQKGQRKHRSERVECA